MLWYKAWLETRTRFLISLCGITLLTSYFVYHQNHEGRDLKGTFWDYHTIHTAHALLVAMWIAAVIFLMMGGLLQEKKSAASSFTLALPLSRERLMRVRILFGLLQATALTIIPWGAMFLVACATGKANSLSQAVFHIVLLAGGGIVFFAIALLVSSLVEGEYTAPAVSLGILFADVIAMGDPPLRAYSPWNFMLGTQYYDRTATQLLLGTIPWMHVVINVLVAGLLTALSIAAIRRRDF